jgi:predicted adenylyl cyclase CyaB
MFEVEIKCLLTKLEEVNLVKEKLQQQYPNLKYKAEHKQRNHYFHPEGDLVLLGEKIKPFLSEEKYQELCVINNSEIANYTLRSREIDSKKVILVLKIQLQSSNYDVTNAKCRREFEVEIPNFTLQQLDDLIISCNYKYMSKWSRSRIEASLEEDLNICFDKNSGYGYIIEIEKIVQNEQKIIEALTELKNIAHKLGLEEINDDRLERMFNFYNQNWRDFYETDKVFNIQ